MSVFVISSFTGCNKSDFSLEKTFGGKPTPVETSQVSSKSESSPTSANSDSDDAVESGWSLYKVPEHNFSLSLPDDWRRTDPPKQIKALEGNFWAYDESSKRTGFATNVIVAREKNPLKATDLDVMVAFNLQELWRTKQITDGTIDHKRLKYAAGECEYFHLTFVQQMPSGVFQECTVTYYLFVKGTESYTVILTTIPKMDRYYKAIFEKIGQSFRFIK
jgi:hypothetical protein